MHEKSATKSINAKSIKNETESSSARLKQDSLHNDKEKLNQIKEAKMAATEQKKTIPFSMKKSNIEVREGSLDSARSASQAKNICPRCGKVTSMKTCQEWEELLRAELREHIESLFRKKMQEFIEFIEEVVNVED